jgi:hypothetical protein
MPKKTESGHDAHEVDQDYGRELDVAGTFIPARIKPRQKLHNSKLFQKTEELVKKPGISKTIDFGYFLALGKVRSDSRLVPGGGAPSETLGYLLRCFGYELHGKTSFFRVSPMLIYTNRRRLSRG